MEKVIVGQRYLVDRLIIGLLANGHLLLEGVPGLAKTLAVKTLAAALHTAFQRIQFTPDLLPADLVGTLIYNPKTGEFGTRKGPVFANIILADEINRAPAKVQSALLEAMQERQVTIGEETFPLPEPFLVLATQNPIEQEGTYPLPEAQVDRFMLKLVVTYPTLEEERRILDANGRTAGRFATSAPSSSPPPSCRARKVVDEIYVDDKIKDYILSHRLRHARSRRLQARGAAGQHPLRRLAARDDLPHPRRPRPRLPAGPRLRHPAGRQVHRPRRPAPPRHPLLRGRGRGNDRRQDRRHPAQRTARPLTRSRTRSVEFRADSRHSQLLILLPV